MRLRYLYMMLPLLGSCLILSAMTDEDGFVTLFNGRDLTGWVGDTRYYTVDEGLLNVRKQPVPGEGQLDANVQPGNLYTAQEYANFILRLEFKLTPGANNGLGIRAPLLGNAAYAGMELQILDNTAEKWANLKPWQYHGSIYGVVPSQRGHLRPVGEWNKQEVIADGRRITVTLNGTVIVDANIDEASHNGCLSGHKHPGLLRSRGHIGFLGHGDEVSFRNIRIRDLDAR